MGTIYFLVRVIVPRIQKETIAATIDEVEKTKLINPTFFAGISQFKSADEDANYLKSIASDEKQLYKMFASQVFALGKINNAKNLNIRKSVYFFVAALVSELMMIMIVAFLVFKSFLFN